MSTSKTPREKIIDTASMVFFDTAIDTRFIDVFTAGYYAAIIDCSNGTNTLDTIARAGASLNKSWPKPKKPEYEHLYRMR